MCTYKRTYVHTYMHAYIHTHSLSAQSITSSPSVSLHIQEHTVGVKLSVPTHLVALATSKTHTHGSNAHLHTQKQAKENTDSESAQSHYCDSQHGKRRALVVWCTESGHTSVLEVKSTPNAAGQKGGFGVDVTLLCSPFEPNGTFVCVCVCDCGLLHVCLCVCVYIYIYIYIYMI